MTTYVVSLFLRQSVSIKPFETPLVQRNRADKQSKQTYLPSLLLEVLLASFFALVAAGHDVSLSADNYAVDQGSVERMKSARCEVDVAVRR